MNVVWYVVMVDRTIIMLAPIIFYHKAELLRKPHTTATNRQKYSKACILRIRVRPVNLPIKRYRNHQKNTANSHTKYRCSLQVKLLHKI